MKQCLSLSPENLLATVMMDTNFYLSQVRITIERTFGILVHRFGILRRPMSMSICKVPALVTCLMRLHNFYIDHEGTYCSKPTLEDEKTIHRMASVKTELH
jgi:hypothetical protein